MKFFWSKWLVSIMLIGANPGALAFELENCHVDGIKEQVLCGTLQVAENPNKPDGKKIPLNITVLKGFNVKPDSHPLLILAGGPGQAATEMTGGINVMFKQVRQTRDIVMIDQRGTGKSNGLQCTNLEMDGLGLDISATQFDLKEQALECVALFKDSDLTQYSTEQAVDDFEAVRQALGYKKFHLYGGSYGTRSGLVYMRRHPDSVESAVLDSVAPTQEPIGLFGQFITDSFELVLQNCRENPQCHEAYPHLKQDFVELMAKLNSEAVTTNVSNPVNAGQETLLFEKDKLLTLLRTSLYSVQTRRMLPLIIHNANNGNYKPFLGLYSAVANGMGLYMGLTMTVICSEDWPRVTPQALAKDDGYYVMGDSVSRTWREMCPSWPKYQVDKSFAEPVVSDIPTLLLSGRLDPVTPPSWGELAAKSLTNSRHLVAHNGAHTIVTHTCAAKLVAQFLDQGALDKLDDSCLTKPQPMRFMINANTTSL